MINVDARESLDLAWAIVENVRFERGVTAIMGDSAGIGVSIPDDPRDCAQLLVMLANIAIQTLEAAHGLCAKLDPPIDVPVEAMVEIVRDMTYGYWPKSRTDDS